MGQAEMSGPQLWAVPPVKSEVSSQFSAVQCFLEVDWPLDPTVREQYLPPTLHCVELWVSYRAIYEVILGEPPI